MGTTLNRCVSVCVFLRFVPVLAAVTAAPFLRAQEPYELRFDGPSTQFEQSVERFTCLLVHPNPSGQVQGWAFGVRPTDATIVGVTFEGTDAAAIFNGGFNSTQLTSGPGNDGLVSAIVLSFGELTVLPAESTSSVLFIDVRVGDEGTMAMLEYTGELSAFVDAPPVAINVTDAGERGPVALHSKEVEAIALVENVARFVQGDANGDRRVNIADAIVILHALFSTEVPLACDLAGDPNGDGVNDVSDGIHLINYRFLGGPPPVAPYPLCGVVSLGQDEPPAGGCESGC